MAIHDAADSFSWGKVLWNMRNDGLLCDVFLGGSEQNATAISAHRLVLSARSSFFRGMFGSSMIESRQKHVLLQNIPSGALASIVKYAYTSEININESNVVSLLEAAIFVDLPSLAETCWDFLADHIDTENCLLIYGPAERHQRIDLAEMAKAEALRHFGLLSQSVEFLHLEKDQVLALIGSDDISIEREDLVLDAVFSWIRHGPAERTRLLEEMLSMVRLKHVDPQHLQRGATELIGQIGQYEADLSDRIQQSIQAASSVDRQPRHESTFSHVFMAFDTNLICIDPRTGTMNRLGSLPKSFVPSGGAALGRFVFVLGRLGGNPAFYRYDLDLLTWTSLAEPQSAHLWGGLVALAGRIYAVGGANRDFGEDNTVECFSPKFNSWQRTADLPMPLKKFGSVVHQGCLFLFGGMFNFTGNVFRYSPRSDIWSVCSQVMPERFDCSACSGEGDTIYVLGGWSLHDDFNSLDAFNSRTNQWLYEGDLPAPGRCLPVGAANGHIYVLGGCDDDLEKGIQAFDVMSHTWTTRAAHWESNSAPVRPLLPSSVCVFVKIRNESEDDSDDEEDGAT